MRIKTVTGILMVVGPVFGQTYQRQATIVGGGSFDNGKCTIEVQVDATAEVQLRGTAGLLRNLAGQPPQWRRFECNAAMPLNPTYFAFRGISGRGQQQLTRNPSTDGNAIIRINDPSGGSSVYAFEVEWQGYNSSLDPFGNSPPSAERSAEPSIFGPVGPGNAAGKGRERPITSAEAVEVCQQEIVRLAEQRFGTSSPYFRRVAVTNNRGGQDRVRGTIDIDTGNNQSQRYRFNCNVNLNNGRVRTAQIDANPVNQNTRDYGYTGGNYDAFGVTNSNRAIQACEAAVDRRLNEQGYQRVFGSIDLDDRTGSDRVFGSVTVADRNQRRQVVDFSCDVNFASGAVSTVNVIPRR